MRILLRAKDAASASDLARLLVARGHAVSVGGGASPSPDVSNGIDVVLADVRVAPSAPAAGCPGAGLVLLAPAGEPVAAGWVRLCPTAVLDLGDDGLPAASPEALDAALEAARDGVAREARAARALEALESTDVPVLLATPSGRVEHANPAALRLLGRESSEGGPARLSDLVAARASDPAAEAFLSAVEAGAAWSGEVRVPVSGGGALPCEAVVTPRRLGGTSTGVVVVLVDATRRHAEEAALRDANRLLAERASTDPLCGLYNRAYLQQALDREVARRRRYGQPFSVLMVDLDDFKRVNDLFGHEVGDDVLRAVAGGLREGLREGDVLARYGGDEFCALLPSTPLDAACQVAERLRERVAQVRAGLATPTRLAASVGIAVTDDLPAESDGADLLRAADRAMMAAKRAGGDRCLHLRPGDPGPAPLPLLPRRAGVSETAPPTSPR